MKNRSALWIRILLAVVLFIVTLICFPISVHGKDAPYTGIWRMQPLSEDKWYAISNGWTFRMPDKFQHLEGAAISTWIGKKVGPRLGISAWASAGIVFGLGCVKEFVKDAKREGWSSRDLICNSIGILREVILPDNIKVYSTFDATQKHILLHIAYVF